LSADLKIPDGFGIEAVRASHMVITKQEDHHKGSVTIDLHGRCFRGGIVYSGPVDSRRTYVGRGWKQQLCDDAVAWLIEVMGPCSER
jgi:hypothetical protein